MIIIRTLSRKDTGRILEYLKKTFEDESPKLFVNHDNGKCFYIATNSKNESNIQMMIVAAQAFNAALCDAPFPAYCPELIYHNNGKQEIVKETERVFVCLTCNCKFNSDNIIIKHGDFYG